MAFDINGFTITIVGDKPEVNALVEQALQQESERIAAYHLDACRKLMLYGTTDLKAIEHG